MTLEDIACYFDSDERRARMLSVTPVARQVLLALIAMNADSRQPRRYADWSAEIQCPPERFVAACAELADNELIIVSTDQADVDRVRFSFPRRAASSDGPLEGAISDFVAYRKERKRPMTRLAMTRLRAKLSAFPCEVAIAAIYESIEHGWTGVYPRHDGAGDSKSLDRVRRSLRTADQRSSQP